MFDKLVTEASGKMSVMALSVEVLTSQIWSLNTDGAGVGGVFISPLRASIIVASRGSAVQGESAQDLRAGQSVFAGGVWHRVRRIELPAGPQRGGITFDSLDSSQTQAMKAGAVVLADGAAATRGRTRHRDCA